jgi:hypothetical protein
MDKIIELFALFLLALLGFVTPVLAIILSIFAPGLAKLEQQYEAELSQTEEKLKNQLQKASETKSLDLKEINKTIRELQTVKNIADRKLQLLTPKKAVVFICAPLFAAFLILMPSLLHQLPVYLKCLSIISLVLVGYSMNKLWHILDIIIEALKLLDLETKNDRRTVPELLAQIVQNTKAGADYFIEKILVEFNGIKIDDKPKEVHLEVNKKSEIPVSIRNTDPRMAKDIEAGFTFPTDFLIEKNDKYSIYTSGSEQVVRYSEARIHGQTHLIKTPLIITPLKKDKYTIDVFIKGENIKSVTKKLTLIVD